MRFPFDKKRKNFEKRVSVYLFHFLNSIFYNSRLRGHNDQQGFLVVCKIQIFPTINMLRSLSVKVSKTDC